MSAISMSVLSLCATGDEIVAMGGLFGGTYSLFHNFASRYGVKAHFIATNDFDALQQVINKQTKVIFCESVGNPNLQLTDIKRLCDIANTHGIASVIDNTVTPLSVQPLKIGADMVVYSTTKLLTGNASALGGMVVFRAVNNSDDKFHTSRYKDVLQVHLDKFPQEAILRAGRAIMRDLGFVGHAMSSYLTLVGMETLPLRLDRLKKSLPIVAKGLKAAGFKVRHPSLAEHEHHHLYNGFYNGYVGSLLTIDFDSDKAAFNFLDRSKLITITANIGDSRTLGLHMASTIYKDYGDEARSFLGVTKGLVRLSVGLENPEDIIADFKQAIS